MPKSKTEPSQLRLQDLVGTSQIHTPAPKVEYILGHYFQNSGEHLIKISGRPEDTGVILSKLSNLIKSMQKTGTSSSMKPNPNSANFTNLFC